MLQLLNKLRRLAYLGFLSIFIHLSSCCQTVIWMGIYLFLVEVTYQFTI